LDVSGSVIEGKVIDMESESMKTLLLVDDELENLRSLGEILNRFGYKVIAKPDAQSALSVVREGAGVDLVITDYRMPGMDGLEFVILLKQILPSVPVVMLTAYGAVETYLKSLSLGVFEYVNKPVKAKELGRIVKAALECSENDDAAEGGTAAVSSIQPS
jgi:DNA-binding NtrC family response regulator